MRKGVDSLLERRGAKEGAKGKYQITESAMWRSKTPDLPNASAERMRTY